MQELTTREKRAQIAAIGSILSNTRPAKTYRFPGHEQPISREQWLSDGNEIARTVYDDGKNCLVCGESGRCPGKHTVNEIKKGVERYKEYEKQHQDCEQVSLF